jgi:hypothetical protein
MKVGSFSPRVSHNLNSFESKSTTPSQTRSAPELPRFNAPTRDGFETRGRLRPQLRPQGDGFESASRPSLLQRLPGRTPVSELTNLVKAGHLQAPTLPKELEPYKGSLDSIAEKAAGNLELDTLGKLRKDISQSVKELGLKGKLAKWATDNALFQAIERKAGAGAQWVPGD